MHLRSRAWPWAVLGTLCALILRCSAEREFSLSVLGRFPDRTQHGMVVTWEQFGPTVIVLGGMTTDGTMLNDVWQAFPTVAFFMWRQLLASNRADSSRWSPRASAGMAALPFTLGRQVIVVTGGYSGGDAFSDTWFSFDDGQNWILADRDNVPARAAFPLVAVNNTELGAPVLPWNEAGRFYALGGLVNLTSPQNDVWMLSDPFNTTAEGPRWKLVLASTNASDPTRWAPRFSHSAVLLRDRIIVCGGSVDHTAVAPAFDDVWVANASMQFSAWTRLPRPANASLAFPLLTSFGMTAILPHEVLVVAGGLASGGFVNALWLSRDAGLTWHHFAPKVANVERGNATGWWTGRSGPSVAYIPVPELLLVSGGRSQYKATSDTWTTPVDGIENEDQWEPTWAIADSSTTLTDYRPGQPRNELDGRFAPRMLFGLVRLSSVGQIFLVGGQTLSDSGVGQVCRNDVWQSYSDYGSQWNMLSGHEPNTSARFRPRCPTVVVGLPTLELLVLPSVAGPLEPMADLEYDPSTWITRDLGRSWELLDEGEKLTSFPQVVAYCAVGLHSGMVVAVGGALYQEGEDFRLWPATNAVWASQDGGRTWSQTSPPCSDQAHCFQPRAAHACVELGGTGKIVLTGGQSWPYPTGAGGAGGSGSGSGSGVPPQSRPLSDSWFSSDLGATWSRLVPPGAPVYPERFLHAMASVGPSCVVVLGGAVTVIIPRDLDSATSLGSVYNDMWQYCVGDTGWTQVVPAKYSSTVWQPRLAHAALASPSGDPIVVGGASTPSVFSMTTLNDLLLNDVWIGSKGGLEWNQVTHSWSRRVWAATAPLLRNGMLVMGGVNSNPSATVPDASVRLLTFRADDNGAQHVVAQLQTSEPPWSARLLACATSFVAQDTESLLQHLYVLLVGGWESGGALAGDVWRCDCGDVDGPEEEVLQRCGVTECWKGLPQSADFPPRVSGAMTATSTRTLSPLPVPVVFLSGGVDHSGHPLDDLWYSIDKGVTFRKHSKPAPWGALSGTVLVAWSNILNVTICAVGGLDASYTVSNRLVCSSAGLSQEWQDGAMDCPWAARMSPVVFQPQSGFLCVMGGRTDFINPANDGLWCAAVGFRYAQQGGATGGGLELIADWKQYQSDGAAGYGGIVMPIVVERTHGSVRPRYFSLWVMGGYLIQDGEALVVGLFQGLLSPAQDGLYRRGSNMTIEWYSFGTVDVGLAPPARSIRALFQGQVVHTIYDAAQRPDLVLVGSYQWTIPRTWPAEWTLGVVIEVHVAADTSAYSSTPVVISDGATAELLVPPSSLAEPTPPGGVPLVLANTTVQLVLTTVGTASRLWLQLMRSELSTNYLSGDGSFAAANEIELGSVDLEARGDSVFSRTHTLRLPVDCLLSNRLVIRTSQAVTGAIADTQGFMVRCAPGWAPNENGTRCQACPEGKFAAADSSSCEACPLGTFADLPGATSVAASKPCPMGTYGRGTGLASEAACTPCPPGMRGVRTGQGSAEDACRACPPGTFGNGLSCSSCIAGKFSNATSAQSPRTCQGCPFLPTTTTPADGAVALDQCICSSGRLWNPSVAQGWGDEGALAASPCASCDDSWLVNPDAFNCTGSGLRLATVGLYAGYWRVGPKSGVALACPLGGEACRGGHLVAAAAAAAAAVGGGDGERGWTNRGSFAASDAQCAPGYRGPRCVLCASGWAPSRGAGGVGVPCVECSSGRKRGARAGLSLLVIAAILVVGALVAYQLRASLRLSPMSLELKHRRASSEAAEPGRRPSTAGQTHAVSKFKIMLACLQIVALTSAITSPASEGGTRGSRGGTVGALLMMTNLSLSYLLGVGCAAHWTLYTEVVLFTAAPLCVILAFSLAGWLLRRYRAVQYELRRLLAVGSFLLFPAISSVLFQVFTCVDLGDGEPRLVSSPSLSCSSDSPSRNFMVGYAVVMLVLFAGGIPVVMTLALRYNRVELKRAIRVGALDELPLRLSYVAFFGAGVRDKWIWYDVAETMRKLLLTAIIKLLAPKLSSSAVPIADDALPLGLASMAALAFTGLYAYARPLALRSSNVLLVYCNATLVCAMQLALLSRAYAATDAANAANAATTSMGTSKAFHVLALLLAFSVIPATVVALIWQHYREEAVRAPEWVTRKLLQRRGRRSFRMPREEEAASGEGGESGGEGYRPPDAVDNPLGVALIVRRAGDGKEGD